MIQGYEYGNARLRAKQSRLLTASDYRGLLARSSVEEMISALTATPYKEDIEAALVRTAGMAAIYTGLRTNLTRMLAQIRQFYGGQARQLLDLLLRRWDRHNLLAILRGQSQEAAPEQVLATLVPVGRLDEAALRELVRQPGLRAAIDLMRTWRLPYAAALGAAGPNAELATLELVLNRTHYAELCQALTPGFDEDPRSAPPGDHNAKLVFDQVQTEIDLINIGVALRLAARPELVSVLQHRLGGSEVRSLLIEPGGSLPTRRLTDLVTEHGGLENAVRALGATRYGPALQRGWARQQAAGGGFAYLERELERQQAEECAVLYRHDPLSIAIPIAFVVGKQVEAANLRLVAQTVALGLAHETTRRDLILM